MASKGTPVPALLTMAAQTTRRTVRKGFSLVELLIVIALIGALVSVVMQAINPHRQLSQTRDAQRRSDVLSILMSFYQYTLDHGGILPPDVPYGEANAKPICKFNADPCTNGINLRSLSGVYLAALPFDPNEPSTSTGTNYYMYAHDANRITVYAPGTEQETEIIKASR